MTANPEYRYHPYCEALPRMDPDAYARRREDYRAHPERASETLVR